MTGTASQIEWAEQIKPRVGAEFDRVAQAFRVVASRQEATGKQNIDAVIAIVEQKRAEVMAMESAGYFIRDWQELTGQVRRMIADDPRYQALPLGKRKRT